jgi:hypothetical protein
MVCQKKKSTFWKGNEKKIPPKDILQELIKKREENVLLLSSWVDKNLKELTTFGTDKCEINTIDFK